MKSKMEYQEVNQTPFAHRVIYLSVAVVISTASIVAMKANAKSTQPPLAAQCLDESCVQMNKQ